MQMQTSKAGLRPEDIPPEEAEKVLSFLNALSTTEEIVNSITSPAGRGIISTRTAQKILQARAKSGGFQDLRQLRLVPRIGSKTFTAIVLALTSDEAGR